MPVCRRRQNSRRTQSTRYEAGSLEPAALWYTASELDVGPALSVRRTSVQPEGAVMPTEDGVTATEATMTSFVARPAGLVIVSVPPAATADVAARKVGVTPATVAEAEARNAICAWAEVATARSTA